MPASKPRKHSISVHFEQGELAMIDRAAALRGSTRTDFVKRAALEAAVHASADPRIILMSDEGLTGLLEVLAQPPKVIPRIAELLARPAPWDLDPKERS